MTLSRKTIQIIAVFTGSFFLCGLLHVALYGIPLTMTITQLFCIAMTMIWGLTIHRRVTDPRLCRLLLWIISFLILLYTFQLLRYNLSGGSVRRCLWYAYYMPMTAIPSLCLYLALYIHLTREEHLKKIWILPAISGIILIVGILTNDLHFLAFYSSNGVLIGDREQQRGPLYFLFLTYFILTMLPFYLIILKKSRLASAGKPSWLPPGILFTEVIIILLEFYDIGPKIHEIAIWNFIQIFGFFTTAFLESCIQIGLIPSNRDYEKLFDLADLSAAILDNNNQLIYKTRITEYPFPENENTEIISHPISGGSIQWSVDITSLRLLNQDLQKTIQQIQARNAYLENENSIREEKSKLETQNQLYRSISGIIAPQIDQIRNLLRNDGSDCPGGSAADSLQKQKSFEQKLSRIAFLTAYIKRRSNLELLSSNKTIPSEELELAVRESMEYLQLTGVNTAVITTGEALYPSGMLTETYEQIEKIIENCLDTLTDIVIILRAELRRLTVRIMLRAAAFSFESDDFLLQKGNCFSRHISVMKDDPDLILILTFTEEGETL